MKLHEYPRASFPWRSLLQNTAGALHGDGDLFVAHLDDIVRDPAQLGRISDFHHQLGRENDPVLMTLENAHAVMKFARFLVEDADLAVIIKSHAAHAFGDSVPVGPRIAVDGSAH